MSILLVGCTKPTIKHEVTAPQLDNLANSLEKKLNSASCPEVACPQITCPKFIMPPLPEKAYIVININGKSLKGTNAEGKEFVKNYVQARKLLK
jgi:hypothetical protein